MRLARRTFLLGSAAVGLSAAASPRLVESGDPTEWVELWPGRAPGGPAAPLVETINERSTDPSYRDRAMLHISRPRMAVFRPAFANGASALIIPGGGYNWVVVDKEGFEFARLLAGLGVTAFVLFYRLPHEGWAAGPNVALGDAQRAVRLIRHRSDEFGLDPDRLAAIGFSAGGHLCADLATRYQVSVYEAVDAADARSARPAAAAPIYPVISMSAPSAHAGSRLRLVGEHASPELERAHSPHLHVRPETPPCFLLHAEDDASVPVANSLMLREALIAQGVPVQTHLFPDGGHGFGLRLSRGKSVENWPELFVAWARYRGLWS